VLKITTGGLIERGCALKENRRSRKGALYIEWEGHLKLDMGGFNEPFMVFAFWILHSELEFHSFDANNFDKETTL